MNISFYKYIKDFFYHINFRSALPAALLLCLLLSSTFGYSVNQTRTGNIDLELSSVTILEGLNALERKAGCVINYNKSILPASSRVSVSIKNATVSQALKELLVNTRVAFKFVDEHTVLLYKLPDLQKPGKVSGKILDEKGETLPGATIKIIETGSSTQTGVDGVYIININPGTYTLEVSYLSYQTQRITGVVVTENKNTPLDIAMKPSNSALKEVVITATYRKTSVEGLLARQKNASEISNGISAEQLARTPDRNIGESLKRISGVSSVDNKFILVRGIGERYNTATLDGTILPSTEAQSRNFSFDLIPSNLVDNVVVSKTVTPDMNASFGGGLIQINTKDIPNENFTSFTAGTSYNDQSTGKDFLSHRRGKYDYLGFDDGRRDFPEDLEHTVRTVAPNTTLSEADYQKKVIDQSKKFTQDNFSIYKNKAAPSQNYQFAIGRLLALDTTNNNKFGFTGALSYRNTQNINIIDKQARGDWNLNAPNNNGASYQFNTTLGGILNFGLQLGNNRFSLRNTYTHLYDNTLVRIIGFSNAESNFNLPPNQIREADDPTFTDLLQNKLMGQHQLGKVTIDWDFARTGINRQEKDLTIASSSPFLIGNQYQYFLNYTNPNQLEVLPTSRHHYHNNEGHYSWNLSATVPFTIADIRSSLKTGYFGNHKKGSFDWQIAAFAGSANLPDSLKYIPVAEKVNPENFGTDKYSYIISPYFLDSYEGKSQTHAGYVMLDNRLFDKLRLVWGLRAEYFKYTEIKNGYNNTQSISGTSAFSVKPDRKWQFLPSANLTYSPSQSFNIRAAVSSSVVRPELLDNSQFYRYSPYLDGQFGNQGLFSTRINSYDIKTEWFPGLGEIISVGGYYKYFDKPSELTVNAQNGNFSYYIRNADWAKVYGLEFELRKSFGFISDAAILKNLTAYGNYTLQKSEVKSTYRGTNPANPSGPPIDVPTTQNRAMYGQAPYLYNAGLQYTGNHFGFNAAYNKSGYKTYIVGDDPSKIEYERPREQLDIQVSYRFLNRRFEIRLNAGNITNNASTFYRNTISYETNPNATDISDSQRLKPGFTNKYEDGDLITFRQKFGRTYSTSITYNF